MKRTRRWPWLLVSGFALATLVGCQTYVPEASLTLPSGFYLKHPPQYIPPSPAYPLSRELTHLEEASLQQQAPPVPPQLAPGGGALP